MTLRTDEELDEAWNNIKSDLEKELNRAVNMVEAQKVVIGETRFRKHLYTALKKLKIKLEVDGFDTQAIEDMFKAIRYVYYGHNNSPNGILEEDFERLELTDTSFRRLAQFNVVKRGDIENRNYWWLTEDYLEAAKELTGEKVKEKSQELESQLSGIPNKVLALFARILEIHMWKPPRFSHHHYQYLYPGKDHHFFVGMPFEPFLRNQEVLNNLDGVAKRLIDLDLGLKVTDYMRGDRYVDYKVNMTRYHLIKESYFVTCEEVVEEIKNILQKRTAKAEPTDILAGELRRYNAYNLLREWHYELETQPRASTEIFKRYLQDNDITFEDLKEELRDYERKGLIKLKTLETVDFPHLQFAGSDPKESFNTIVKSLEDSILASFTSN